MDGARAPRRFPPRELALVILSSALVIGALYLWGTQRAGLFKDDTEYYGRLAENLADPAHLPYTFRLLTPWIVSLLPMETAAGFTVVTAISLVSAAVMVYVFSARLGYSLVACLGALAVFLFSSVVIRMLTTPTYVDPLTYALSMASLLALLSAPRRRLLRARHDRSAKSRDGAATATVLSCRTLADSWSLVIDSSDGRMRDTGSGPRGHRADEASGPAPGGRRAGRPPIAQLHRVRAACPAAGRSYGCVLSVRRCLGGAVSGLALCFLAGCSCMARW